MALGLLTNGLRGRQPTIVGLPLVV